MYRGSDGRVRRLTIGRHGSPWTPELARDKAKQLLGVVAKGDDPAAEKQEARKALTVGELCERYLADAEAGRILGRGGLPKKASTLALDRGRITAHIKPALGRLKVASVTRADVNRVMHEIGAGQTRERQKTKPRGVSIVRGGRTAATRVIGLLGGIFSYAVERGMRADNPVRGVKKFADRKRERRLSSDEYAALGEGLRMADADGIWPPAVACTRFIALTGWRRGEALGLRRQDVDTDRRTAILADTKTGRSVRPLATAACDILRDLKQPGESDLAFPASRGDGQMDGYFKLWRRIAKLAALPADVTPHILRHSFASVAADLGYSEPTIAALVGHQGRTVTSRYTHAADAVMLAAADAVAKRIGELMGEISKTGQVVPSVGDEEHSVAVAIAHMEASSLLPDGDGDADANEPRAPMGSKDGSGSLVPTPANS